MTNSMVLQEQIITDYSDIERQFADELFSLHYEDLIKIARFRRRRSHGNSTLNTIDILHESYLKLYGKSGWVSREHFINAAALAMRQVIVDYARRKQSIKRGNNTPINSLNNNEAALPEYWESTEQIIEISNLMEKLRLENTRWMRVVDARYFCGFTEDETALILRLSPRTVRRDWQLARTWMANMMDINSNN